MSRKIDFIVIHCTATSPNTTVGAIQRYWREEKGWKSPGYHYMVKADGEVKQLLDENYIANGVKGYNERCIHLSYIGGENGKDTRTIEQKASICALVDELKERYPKAIVQGHRDFPGVKKSCPNFEVKNEFKN